MTEAEVIKGKNCFCSGIKDEDGNLIKCMLCKARERKLNPFTKEEKAKIKQLQKELFSPINHRMNGKYNARGYEIREELRKLRGY